MATSERAADRGKSKAIGALRAIGSDIRLARRSRGLSLEVVARELKLSAAELSRIERAQVEGASLVVLGQLCAVVGLDLAARTYPGGSPIRDARHGRLLMRLHRGIHPGLGWALEVPFPNPGDPRAWDALIKGEDWRYGVEAELNPIDGQALIRRINQKQRDGMVDGVILLLPETRQVREFRREFRDTLAIEFSVPGALALKRLAAGQDPGGNTIIVL